MTTSMLLVRRKPDTPDRGRHRLPDLCPTDTTRPPTAAHRVIDALVRAGTPIALELSHLDIQSYGDTPTGRRRARAAVLLALALPGTVHFHEADQWGLFDNPDEARPSGQRSGPRRPTQADTSLARLCRSALRIRRNHTTPVVEWLPSPPDVLSFRRPDGTTGTDLVCTLNAGPEVVAMACVGSPTLASSYYGLRDNDLLLPPDTVVWSNHRHPR